MWECPSCHESVEDTFEVCWSCGTTKYGEEDPAFRRETDAADSDDSCSPEPDAVAGDVASQAVQLPCPVCGRVDFAWGELTASRLVFLGKDTSPMVRFFQPDRVVARKCNGCGNIQIFER